MVSALISRKRLLEAKDKKAELAVLYGFLNELKMRKTTVYFFINKRLSST